MEILIVRHGETDFNKNNIKQGQEFDVPLNNTGLEQAKKTGLYLRDHLKNNNYNLDAIYCSKLLRAKQTADIIQNIIGFNKNIIFDDRLMENREGLLAGKTQPEIDKFVNSYPELNKLISEYNSITDPIIKNKLFFSYNSRISKLLNGESYTDLMKRSYNFISEIIKMDYSRILIISHNDIMCAMLSRIFKIFTYYKPYFVYGEMVPNITNCWVCNIIYSKKMEDFLMVSLPSNIHLMKY